MFAISATDAIKGFNVELLEELPFDNPIFFAKAMKADLFPPGTADGIAAKPTRADKVAYFLQHVVEPGADDYLPQLLKVMKDSKFYNVVKLAGKIEAALELANDNKCSEAIKNIKKHYSKLIKGFPIDYLVPQLYVKKVINDEQKEEIQWKKSKRDKVSFLFDDVILPKLVVGVSTKYDKLIKVMKASDDSTAKHLANLLEENYKVKEDSTHDKLDSNRNFKELYSQAINNLGSEELQLCKIVFFGPPGVGKSSLCRILIKLPKSKRDSTGLFDLKLVQFKVEVTKDDKECKSVWNVVTLEEEIKRLQDNIERKLNEKKSPAKKQQEVSDKVQQEQPSLENATLPNIEKDKNIHEVVCQKSLDSSSKKETEYKTSNIIIALYDSGGQPEFFDVMPLLNTVPTGNVMIFNLNEPLDAKVSPKLYQKGHLVSTGKITDYTNAELMKTALANIESCVTKQTSLCINRADNSPNNKIVVVGTHLDKYMEGKENVDEALSQIDDDLNKNVLSKSTRDMIVYYKREGKEDRIVHPISNTKYSTEQDEIAQTLRTSIEEMATSVDSQKRIPNNWLLFQYQIRLLGKHCITLSECQDIAKKICYVTEDVTVVLRYFHDLGILLNYKELNDIVFCDPQWLFEQLSKIIRAKYNKTFRADVENGIVKKSFMAKNVYSSLEKDTDNIIKLNDLIKLFVSLNIMAELPKNLSQSMPDDKQYFMPALLDAAPQNFSLSKLGKTFYDTMYVLYKGSLFPRGMFCCLLTHLTQDQRNFELLENKKYMCKNMIVFIITDKNDNYLILSDKINYMTVELYQQYQCNLLQNVYCELLEALQQVCEKMKICYQFEFGFACPEQSCQEKNSQGKITNIGIVELNQHSFCPNVMRCKDCRTPVQLTYNQLLWFIPLPVVDVFKAEVRK